MFVFGISVQKWRDNEALCWAGQGPQRSAESAGSGARDKGHDGSRWADGRRHDAHVRHQPWRQSRQNRVYAAVGQHVWPVVGRSEPAALLPHFKALCIIYNVLFALHSLCHWFFDTWALPGFRFSVGWQQKCKARSSMRVDLSPRLGGTHWPINPHYCPPLIHLHSPPSPGTV